MATPTISTVSPNSGPAAGRNLVTITGTDFKVPTVPYAIPTPAAVPTVRVTVGNRVAPLVEVLSTTELRFAAPRLWHAVETVDAFSAQAVKVENLDANGDPIAGESATKNGAYTYERWVLGAPEEDPPLFKIGRELIWALKLEVDRHVHRATHVDYGEQGAVVVQVARLPSVSLTMQTPLDPEYSWDNYPEDVERPDGSIWRFWNVRTHMLVVDFYLAGEGSREAGFLTKAIEQFTQKNPTLNVLADQTLYPGEEDEYPVEISQEATNVSMPNESSIVTYMMQLRVRGIAVMADEPHEIHQPIADFILAMSDMDATAPTEMTI